MRTLFLDFDGVTHSTGSAPGYSLPFEWVPVLNELLCSAPDVQIVIHSSWAEHYSLDELRTFLEPLGDRVVGVVGRGRRSDAISEFLRANPGVDRWLVLDDAPGEFTEEMLNSVVVCNPSRGLSDPAVQCQIRRWLAGTLAGGATVVG